MNKDILQNILFKMGKIYVYISLKLINNVPALW